MFISRGIASDPGQRVGRSPPHPLRFVLGTFVARKVQPPTRSSTLFELCVHTRSALLAGCSQRDPPSNKTGVVPQENDPPSGRCESRTHRCHSTSVTYYNPLGSILTAWHASYTSSAMHVCVVFVVYPLQRTGIQSIRITMNETARYFLFYRAFCLFFLLALSLFPVSRLSYLWWCLFPRMCECFCLPTMSLKEFLTVSTVVCDHFALP